MNKNQEARLESIVKMIKAISASEKMIIHTVTDHLRKERFKEMEKRYMTSLDVVIKDLEALASLSKTTKPDDLSGITDTFDALKNIESSSRIIERSQPEGLEAKFDRLMKAITKLHPSIAIDVPEQEEMYLALHSLKDTVTYI